MPRKPASAPERIGLRDIARAAGVCLMTVSLSLRNSPKISAQTRRRVRDIAARLGYRPDPEISRLMSRLRFSRRTPGSEVIAMIGLRSADDPDLEPYDMSIRNGVTLHADALGFGASYFRLSDYAGRIGRLLRVIRSRGITGAILLPSNRPPVVLDVDANWDGISVVAATTSVSSPRFHQVVPNQLYNIMTLIECVQQKGYRRLGAIFSETLEQRTAHQYSLALAWHGHRDRILILPSATTPAENAGLVKSWVKTHRPDVVLAQEPDPVAELVRSARLVNTIDLVALNRTDRRMPYQDQLPELIGESAVSLLTGMMHNNETGVPEHPRITTIDGVFRDPTARPAR